MARQRTTALDRTIADLQEQIAAKSVAADHARAIAEAEIMALFAAVDALNAQRKPKAPKPDASTVTV